MKWWSKVLWPAANPLPFAGIRWARWLLVLGCIAVPILSVCPDDTGLNRFALQLLAGASLIVTMMGCMWEAHMRTWLTGAISYRRWFMRTVRNLFSVLGGVLLLSIPLGMLLPSYGCYGNRARVSEVLAVASRTKQLVAEKALDAKTLNDVGVGLTLEPSRYLTFGHVSRDGTIMLFVGEAKAAVVLEPTITNPQTGEVTWKCRGAPPRAIPAECRQP